MRSRHWDFDQPTAQPTVPTTTTADLPMPTAKPSRRNAIKSVGALAVPWVMSSTMPRAAASLVSDKIEIGVIGIGMRGKFLLANLPESFRVTALCDCSLDQIKTATHPTGRFTKILERFAKGDAKTCKVYQDYRKMLGTQKFDAIIIAAPDHHHAGAAILAMRSGADVYVEKPLAVTIEESRAIADAAQRLKRVVQVGSQQRTMSINQRACEFIRDGGLGKIHLVEERNLPGPMPVIAKEFPQQSLPSTMNWDMFCGPTPLRPYNKDLWVKDAYRFGYLVWRGWDLFRDYSGHLMTNWGAHSVDMVQYALGKDDTGPTRVERLVDDLGGYVDDQWHEKTPPLGTLKDKAIDRARFCPIKMTYGDGTVIHFKPGIRRTIFHGEKGTMEMSRNDYKTSPGSLLPAPPKDEKERWAGDGHVARPHIENWEQAMRARSTPNAPPEVGHRSITACHLANIARQIEHPLHWDPAAESFKDPADNQFLSRPRRVGFELPQL